MVRQHMTYQAMQEELDKLINDFQSKDLDIDEAVKNYERATKLIKQLENYLDSAENKITQLRLRSKSNTDA